MIPTPRVLIRVGLLTLAVVVVQISAIVDISVLDGNPDLIPLYVAALALFAGSVPGAAAGFFTGLLLDLAIGQHVGASSLVLTAVGYAVGRVREVRDPAHGLTPLPVGAGATAGYGLGIAAVTFMLSIEAEVSLLAFREMLVAVLLNTLIALPVFALFRRALRPALVVDPLERSRRRQPGRPAGLRGLEA